MTTAATCPQSARESLLQPKRNDNYGDEARRNLRIRLEVMAEFAGCATVGRYLDSEREARE